MILNQISSIGGENIETRKDDYSGYYQSGYTPVRVKQRSTFYRGAKTVFKLFSF